MGGCLSVCLSWLRTLFPWNFLLQTPPSSPWAPADSPPSPLAAAPAHDSPLPQTTDGEQHEATLSETEPDRSLEEIPEQDVLPDVGADEDFCSSRLETEKGNEELEAVCLSKRQLNSSALESKDEEAELHHKQSPLLEEIPEQDVLPDLVADEDFCRSRVATENSNEELEAVCHRKRQLNSSALESKDEEAELHQQQSPPQGYEEFCRRWEAEVSDPISPLDSELFTHEYKLPSGTDHFPRVPSPQHGRVISAHADQESTNQPWQQGDEVPDYLLPVDHHAPVSYLSDESYRCSPGWYAPLPPPSLPYPPSQLPEDTLTEDLPFRSREIIPQGGLSHRSERKKAITAYGDTKSASSSK